MAETVDDMSTAKNKRLLHRDVGELLKSKHHLSLFSLLLISAVIFITAFFAGTQTAGVFQLAPKAFFGTQAGSFRVAVQEDTPTPTPAATVHTCWKCENSQCLDTGEKYNAKCSLLDPYYFDNFNQCRASGCGNYPTDTPTPEYSGAHYCYQCTNNGCVRDDDKYNADCKIKGSSYYNSYGICLSKCSGDQVTLTPTTAKGPPTSAPQSTAVPTTGGGGGGGCGHQVNCSGNCQSNNDGSYNFCYNQCIPGQPGYSQSVGCDCSGWKTGGAQSDPACGGSGVTPGGGGGGGGGKTGENCGKTGPNNGCDSRSSCIAGGGTPMGGMDCPGGQICCGN